MYGELEIGIGANSGYKHEPRNRGHSCLSRYILGPSYMDGLEGHPTLLDIGRDRVDHGVGQRQWRRRQRTGRARRQGRS